MLAVVAIPAGLLIGLSLGALGGGGSILTVPVLVYLLRQPPHPATARSLLIAASSAPGQGRAPAHGGHHGARRDDRSPPGGPGPPGPGRRLRLPRRGRRLRRH